MRAALGPTATEGAPRTSQACAGGVSCPRNRRVAPFTSSASVGGFVQALIVSARPGGHSRAALALSAAVQ